MNKVFFVILLVIAIPLYVWDVYSILRAYRTPLVYKNTSVTSDSTAISKPFRTNRVGFIQMGKSPLLPYREDSKPKLIMSSQQKSTSRIAKKPRPDIPAPNITINSLLWNPNSPVVIINLPDGSTAVAKPGQWIGGILVKKIEQNKILLDINKNEYWIEK